MDDQTDRASAPVLTEPSLVRGGPFHRIQHGLGLIPSNRWNLGRRITILIAISWLPMVFITIFANPAGLRSLLLDSRVYARLFIAIPALIVGEVVIDTYFRTVLARIRNADLLDATAQAYMDRILAGMLRLRDTFLPQLILLIPVGLNVHLAMSDPKVLDTTPWLGYRYADGYHFTTAALYGVVVGAPLWNFLLGLALWRWLLWTFFAFKLSKQRLKLEASHPDKHGGLGFLGLMVTAFAPTAFAANAVIASNWRHMILHHGAHLADFKLSAITLVCIIVLFALGPLSFFAPRLFALRLKGILEYGILGQLHSSEFYDKWIQQRSGHEAEFLAAPEISALTDFGTSYEKIEHLRPFPVDMGSLYVLLLAVVGPGLFVVLAQIPLTTVLGGLLKAIH